MTIDAMIWFILIGIGFAIVATLLTIIVNRILDYDEMDKDNSICHHRGGDGDYDGGDDGTVEA